MKPLKYTSYSQDQITAFVKSNSPQNVSAIKSSYGLRGFNDVVDKINFAREFLSNSKIKVATNSPLNPRFYYEVATPEQIHAHVAHASRSSLDQAIQTHRKNGNHHIVAAIKAVRTELHIKKLQVKCEEVLENNRLTAAA
jgi:hypothetical protein